MPDDDATKMDDDEYAAPGNFSEARKVIANLRSDLKIRKEEVNRLHGELRAAVERGRRLEAEIEERAKRSLGKIEELNAQIATAAVVVQHTTTLCNQVETERQALAVKCNELSLSVARGLEDRMSLIEWLKWRGGVCAEAATQIEAGVHTDPVVRQRVQIDARLRLLDQERQQLLAEEAQLAKHGSRMPKSRPEEVDDPETETYPDDGAFAGAADLVEDR